MPSAPAAVGENSNATVAGLGSGKVPAVDRVVFPAQYGYRALSRELWSARLHFAGECGIRVIWHKMKNRHHSGLGGLLGCWTLYRSQKVVTID